MTRKQLQDNIKSARAAKRAKLDARNLALAAIKTARVEYNDAVKALATAQAALKAFDNGDAPAA